MIKLKTFSEYLFLAFPFFILLSCSGSKNQSDNSFRDFYLNPKYENEKYNNASLGIIIQDQGLDTLSNLELIDANLNMISFGKVFIKYFPIGVKNFSTLKEANWIYYNQDPYRESIEYNFKPSAGKEIFIWLPDSMNNFQGKSNADFLMFIQNLTIIQSNPDQLSQNSSIEKKYKTRIEMEYCIWDNSNLDLITKDKIITISVFDKLPETWPFNNVILKMSAEIFNKLPMFSK